MTNETHSAWPGWETVRLIGSGSFGAVYEIQRDVLGTIEKAALKVISVPQNDSDLDELRAEGYDDESITQRFSGFAEDIIREYNMMVQMKGNANIVYCDDYKITQQDDGLGWDIYIKMEFLTPLMKALEQVSAEEQIIRFGIELCNALEVCQKRNVIHRDIKPQNIFVSDDGVFKLGDFGIAKTVEKTVGGTKIGTYKYMAPEVYNNQPYNSTADIYSLGLVLYWLLNERRMPFMPLPPDKQTTEMDEEARHRRFAGDHIPAPKNGSNELKRIVLKACAFDPKERYQTARQMREDLLRLSGQTVPIPEPEPIKKPDVDDDATVGPDFDHSSGEDTAVDNTVGPVFNQTTANLDIHLEKVLDVRAIPQNRMIPLSIDGQTVTVRLPEPLESGRTCCYQSLGWTGPQGQRGNLYVTFHLTNSVPVPPVPPVQPAQKSNTGLIAAVLVVILVLILFVAIGKNNDGMTNLSSTGTADENTPVNTIAHTHTWLDATCTAPKTCSSCHMTVGSPSGHIWIGTSATAPKTCKFCGITDSSTLSPYAQLSVGDVFTFGTYEQDNYAANGDEDIEWIVLDKKDGKILAISRYSIDSRPFHIRTEEVTWSTSSIRDWLNGAFYQDAFNTKEQSVILRNAGDRVFLLSLNELLTYLTTDASRTCRATSYAIAQDAYVNTGTGGSWWFLRTPAESNLYVMSVNSDGSVDYDGSKVSASHGTIRPAIWISTE